VFTKGHEEKEKLHTINKTRANWMCHILRRKNLIKHFMEGRVRGKGRSDEKTRKKTYANTGLS
jgi:hypothetical protein